ncbi:TPA: hypothetical protein DCZ46_00930 [Candidatus Campbellbacteria bacterium]|uniref:Transcription regulator TrmB N-terminal domain-containing protein n=2 Tax=Candidatus Campbelliibacteriota TaxID=1752727 RepID=A0A1F5EMM3_9BACT|nr:MAG: transcriptional regulator TrmB [Candidatus Campbellbacteria bacterium GW2011_OD1_34_28]KKP75350.1 MAG: Transcriptional regulator, TrmB [Candidatus Campbellbacteria bacterium GW2011_GWD2_35_24]KKP76089.1 MAG: transcriptional regulator TrmB [Candidatus Campbellbacteria bacterium GW2011_GWC2_35_28]KKP77278.1 MAG: Transcriptional regulator, TrmB [Candidatus Campbellbacteria bacterium GW2011_GWC1_35_31]KKP79207.1 MAG: Transcriptional regulator, TrmB [Candidatus Campbellbacteria bacterium GW2
MSLLNELKEAGLSINEAKVYLASLELGESTIVRISQKSKVKRATVYLAIDSLKEQGLISFTKRKNKTLFFAEDPRKLQEKIEEKKEKIAKIMPELLSFSNLIDKKPKIKYFEGREPVKEIFRDLLNYPNQELIGWFPDQSYWLGDDFFSDYFIPKRMAKKIWIRSIAPITDYNKKFAELGKKQLKKTRFVDNDKYNIHIQILVYGKNKIAIISYTEEIGLIIESKNIYEALESIFNVMWESLPEGK